MLISPMAPLVDEEQQAINSARAFAGAGDCESALAVLRKARRVQDTLSLLNCEWQVLNSCDRLDAVRDTAAEIKAAYPRDPSGWIANCWYLWRTDQVEPCLREAEILAGGFPAAFEGLFFLILTLKHLKRFSKAEWIAKLAIKKFPDRNYARALLAEILDETGRTEEAVDLLENAVESGGALAEVAPVYLNLKLKLVAQPTPQDWQNLIRVASLCPETAGTLAQAVFRHLKPEDTAGYIQELAETFTNDSQVLEIAARHRIDVGDTAHACAYLSRLSENSPNSMLAVRTSAELLLSLHRWDELQRHLSDHATLITGTAHDAESGCIILESLWACAQNGVPADFGFDAIRSTDKRVMRALSDFLSGNPFNVSRDYVEENVILPTVATYFRTHSFAHSTWRRPVAGYDCRAIQKHILDLLHAETPFSLIRLGDGEGSFLARDPAMAHIGGATIRLDSANHVEIPKLDDNIYDELRATLLTAVTSCDILGVPNEFTCAVEPKFRFCFDAIARAEGAGAYSLTDNCVHYGLAKTGLLELLVARQVLSARQTYYVGPHHPRTFDDAFVLNDHVKHIPIPPEALYFSSNLQTKPHFPDYYQINRDLIAGIPPNSFVLVSAGILGKIYCHWAKEAGAYAIDIGAVSDYWAGHSTRPNGRRSDLTSGFQTIDAVMDAARDQLMSPAH